MSCWWLVVTETRELDEFAAWRTESSNDVFFGNERSLKRVFSRRFPFDNIKIFSLSAEGEKIERKDLSTEIMRRISIRFVSSAR